MLVTLYNNIDDFLHRSIFHTRFFIPTHCLVTAFPNKNASISDTHATNIDGKPSHTKLRIILNSGDLFNLKARPVLYYQLSNFTFKLSSLRYFFEDQTTTPLKIRELLETRTSHFKKSRSLQSQILLYKVPDYETRKIRALSKVHYVTPLNSLRSSDFIQNRNAAFDKSEIFLGTSSELRNQYFDDNSVESKKCSEDNLLINCSN